MRFVPYLRIALVVLVGCQSSTRDEPRPEAKTTATTVTKPVVRNDRPAPTHVPPPADLAAPPADAQKTDKGVFYKILAHGEGKEHPIATSQVKVLFVGWTSDGESFGNSATDAPIPFARVIPGWADGLQVMVVGDKARFWIPQELAYQGRAGRPSGTLVFDVELLGIFPGDPDSAPPLDVSPDPLVKRRFPSPHRFPPGASIKNPMAPHAGPSAPSSTPP